MTITPLHNLTPGDVLADGRTVDTIAMDGSGMYRVWFTDGTVLRRPYSFTVTVA